MTCVCPVDTWSIAWAVLFVDVDYRHLEREHASELALQELLATILQVPA
jgi:hypothetical protein